MKGFAIGLLNFILFLCLCVLGVAVMLNLTILNPDFVVRQLDKIDTTSLIKEQLEAQFTPQIPPEFQSMAVTVIDDIVDEFEPMIKEQASAAIYPVYDYFLGKSEHITVVIDIGPIKEHLHDTLKEAFLESPPPQLASLPREQLEQGFEQFYQGFAREIPSTFEADESMLPSEVRDIADQIRQYIGYYQIGWKALAGLAGLLVLLIIVIAREVRLATRGLGITFMVVGAIGLAAFFLAGGFILPMLPPFGIPTQLQSVIPTLLTDILNPMKWYSIGLLAGGVILLVVSFVHKPREI